MSKVLLICASPRHNGTSVMLLKRIQKVLGGEIVFLPQKGGFDELIKKMKEVTTIVISGPTYINTYPAKLYEFIEEASKNKFSKQKLYGIINGGMPYVHTHEHGLLYLELFAEENNFSWMGGFVLGGGAILDGQPLEKHMNHKKVVPAFDKFIQYINNGEHSPNNLYKDIEIKMPKFITVILSKILTFKVKSNLKKYGYKPRNSNWYLN